MNTELTQRVTAFIAKHHVMSLASCSTEGPHAANLLYAHDGLSLFWVSDPKTRHSRDIAHEPRVAITIAPDTSDFSNICGVQLSGKALRIDAEDRRSWHLARLAERYSFLRQLADAPAALQAAYARAAVYRFEPFRVALIDNTSGFGHKEFLDLREGEFKAEALNNRTTVRRTQ